METGKADADGTVRANRFIGPAGVMATACRQRGTDATREAPAVILIGSTGDSRGSGWAVWGGGEARRYRGSRVMPVEGRGLS
jgi:hypothetical protein